MAHWCLNNLRESYDDICVVFANTGQENEETLEFADKCDKYFNLGLVWVEAEIHHGVRAGPTARIVDFKTASRNGEPFEEMIKKYGIPNQKYPHCTRALKLNPIRDYAKQVGWKDYDTAIGIRADEIDRMSGDAKKNQIIYPLIKPHPMTKPQINTWWAQQPFRLNLKGYQGNCKWCWKKSIRKHLTLMGEDISMFEFPQRMEVTYGLVGPEFAKGTIEGYRRTFFRGNKSTEDLHALYINRPPDFVPATDDAAVYVEDLDVGGGCSESCEVFSDEDIGRESYDLT
jgi:hypothetical protein